VVLQMGRWGARWLDLAPVDYDAAVVLWAWAKFVDADRLPPHRVVVRFDISDDPTSATGCCCSAQSPRCASKTPA
jgi:hypothetical protein